MKQLNSQHFSELKQTLAEYPYTFYMLERDGHTCLCFFEEIPAAQIIEIERILSKIDSGGQVLNWYGDQQGFLDDEAENFLLIQANQLFSDIENSTIEAFTRKFQSLGFYENKTEFGCIMNCGLNSQWHNIIHTIKIEEAPYSPKIHFLMSQFKDLPFSFWLGPNCIPPDIRMCLEKEGCGKPKMQYGMVRDLDSFVYNQNSRQLVIRPVVDKKIVDDFISIYATNYPCAHEFYKNTTYDDTLRPFDRRFVGYYRDVPVSIVSANLVGKVFGLSNLVTLGAYRGRGFGTDLLYYLMGEMKLLGARKIQLISSSKLSRRLYERHGFRVIGLFVDVNGPE